MIKILVLFFQSQVDFIFILEYNNLRKRE